MKYSAGQAAKATGKSIPTITRAIKNGVISASRKSGGGYEIDPAELHRKFPAVTSVSDVIVTELGRETPIIPNALQDKVKMLEEALADVRDDRDALSPPVACYRLPKADDAHVVRSPLWE